MLRFRKGIRFSPWLNLSLNLMHALYNAVLGFALKSEWFVCAAAYYAMLSVLRFSAIQFGRRNHKRSAQFFIAKFTGVMFLLLAMILAASVFLTLTRDTAAKHHEIIMISIATYSFTKLTLAITKYSKTLYRRNPLMTALRSISFADGAVSLFSMQKSMLASFGDMSARDILILNAFTGTAVCVLVVCLGIYLINFERRKRKMSKSKFIQANEKIAEGVVSGFEKISNAVTDGYKKIESGTVNAYTKIEDKFIDRYLAREDETVESAKQRIKDKLK